MFDSSLMRPVTGSGGGFDSSSHQVFVAEPNLDELMHDPMTLALMAADNVDRCTLHSLLAQVSRNLR